MSGQITAAQILQSIPGPVDGAEVYEIRSWQRPLQFGSGALESVKAVETAGRALRLIRDGRLGFSTTTDLADATTLVRNALESAQFGDAVSFHFPAQPPARAALVWDDEIGRLDDEALIALGEEIIAGVQDYDLALQIDLRLGKRVEEVHLVNSSGLDFAERRSALTATLDVTRAAEGDILVVFARSGSRQRQGLDGAAMARCVVERLRWSDRLVGLEGKLLPVAFNGEGTMPLLLPLMAGLNGRNVLLGASPLAGKAGQPILDPRFTLVDDARLDWALRTGTLDDEGIPTAPKHLVEGGVLRAFLYDLKTAAQAGATPTGNGYRSQVFGGGDFRNPPDVAESSWLVQPGERSLQQILGDLGECLLVEDVIGLGQGNVIAGEFSNNVSLGFLVRGGEVVGRVKNTMVAGNVYELLKDHLLALGDRAEQVWGSLFVPAIALDGVGVVSGP
jgi:PmbA protein